MYLTRGRRIGRVGRRRQRRRGRHRLVHGRQRHAQPGRGAERGPGLAAARPGAEDVKSTAAARLLAMPAALHPGPDRAGGADGSCATATTRSTSNCAGACCSAWIARRATELVMTHEAMSDLLGVRREGVTAAALKLQQAGLIRYRRGRIAVLDRARLEQCAVASATPRQRRSTSACCRRGSPWHRLRWPDTSVSSAPPQRGGWFQRNCDGKVFTKRGRSGMRTWRRSTSTWCSALNSEKVRLTVSSAMPR